MPSRPDPLFGLTRRKATHDDLELLFEINRAAMRDHVIRNFGSWDEADQRWMFWRSTRPADHELIFELAEAVGFFAVVRTAAAIDLQRISILPAYQRRGIGTALLEELIAEARTTASALTLQVFLTNPARRLYERLGFAVVRTTATHHHMALRND